MELSRSNIKRAQLSARLQVSLKGAKNRLKTKDKEQKEITIQGARNRIAKDSETARGSKAGSSKNQANLFAFRGRLEADQAPRAD